MPQVQTIDLSPVKRANTPLENTLAGFSQRHRENQVQQQETDSLSSIYKQYQDDGKNLEDAIMKIQSDPNIRPTSKVNTINQLVGFQKHNAELQDKVRKQAKDEDEKKTNQAILTDLETRRNLPKDSLKAYANDPKMAEAVTRPPKEGKINQADRPIDPDQQQRIDQAMADPHWEKATPGQRQQLLGRAGVSVSNQKPIIDTSVEEIKVNQKKEEAQAKAIGESYKENLPFINKVHDQYEDTLRRESLLERQGQLEDEGDVSESGVINFLEAVGLKPEWLKNPANEEYTKLGLDLLGGGTLQADYGSRVLASEFMVSQQRIPTLSQTPEGRRQIRENIRTLMLPSRLKEERLQYYLDKAQRTGEPLPHDLRGTILRDIKPQLEEAYDKFKQRNGRYKVREGTIPDDNAIEKYYFISGGKEDKAMKMMQEDGYDIAE